MRIDVRPLNCVLLVVVLLLGTATASAQPPVTPQADVPTPVARGWVLTPSLAYGLNWDDNILIQGRGEDTRHDFLNAVSPRGSLDYRNKRTQFSMMYDGTILLYTRIDGLNAYDQRASAVYRRTLTRRLTLFAQNGLAVSPTTELTEIVGVPFVRTGSRVLDVRSGAEIALSKVATLTAAYTFQWVSFGRRPQATFSPLLGGQSHGGSGSYRYRFSARTALIADYTRQHATISSTLDTFDIQNGSVGVERTDSRQFTYTAAIGVSRLGASQLGAARTGPAWQLALGRQFQRGHVDVSYSRSFVPSYGFGGTVQNEQVGANVRAPLTRRLSSRVSVAWRRNEPLAIADPSLWSWWIEGGLTYPLRPWLHLQTFYSTDRQRIDRPGGAIARNRIGFQLATGRALLIH